MTIFALVEVCGNVAELENALADFSRVKPQLVAKLDKAKQQLSEFQRGTPK